MNRYLDFIQESADAASKEIRLALGASQSDINESSLPAGAEQSDGGSGGGLPPASQTGGSGGPSMEARVAVLEAHVEHIKDDLTKLADVPARLARVQAKVEELPTKDWIATRLQIYLGIMIAVSALATYATTLVK